MDSSLKKHYDVHEFNPKTLLDTYFSPKTHASILQESTINLMTVLHEAFSSGRVTGKSLIDISIGPIIIQLLAVCEFLDDITVLEFSDVSIKEMEKWMNKDPECYDWTHALTIMAELKGNSDEMNERENLLRKKVKGQIVKCDFSKDNPTDPLVLTKADCVMSIWGLDFLSKDQDDFRKNLKKISSFIKLGGCLLIYADINASYAVFGEHKYHIFTYDDIFLRKALSDEGYEIEHYQDIERKMIPDLIDHEKKVFVIARKVREVEDQRVFVCNPSVISPCI